MKKDSLGRLGRVLDSSKLVCSVIILDYVSQRRDMMQDHCTQEDELIIQHVQLDTARS